jgi:hypothetical protein
MFIQLLDHNGKDYYAHRPNMTSDETISHVISIIKANPQIYSIDLRHNKIGAKVAKDLGIALKGSNVTTIDLSWNNIGADGAKDLGIALKDTNITTINLSWNNIGPKGAQDLVLALKDTNVTTIDLRHNEIGAQGAKDLGVALKGSNITTINLSWNNIGDQGAKDLGVALKGSNVTKIDLRSNNIGNEGAKDLVVALKGTNVITIDLSYNKIGNEGAKDLVVALKGTNVITIDLSYNKIGDQGAKDLGVALKYTNVTTINLGFNKIGAQGAKDLVVALKDTNVTTIDLMGNDRIGDQELEDLEEMMLANKIQILQMLDIASWPLEWQTDSTLLEYFALVTERNKLIQDESSSGTDLTTVTQRLIEFAVRNASYTKFIVQDCIKNQDFETAKLIIDSCVDIQQNSILAKCRDSFFDIPFPEEFDPLIGSYIELFDKFMGKADISGKLDILVQVINTCNMLAIRKVWPEIKGQTIELFQKYYPLVAEAIQRQSHFEESYEKLIEILTQNEETLEVQDECNPLMGDSTAEKD